MLAYVFCHWPLGDVDHLDYEERQRAFHAALAQSSPPGFRGSFAFRLEASPPWLSGAPSYVDWYVLNDSAALDPLNVAAVTGLCSDPHAAVAQAMAAGAGSVFGLRGTS